MNDFSKERSSYIDINIFFLNRFRSFLKHINNIAIGMFLCKFNTKYGKTELIYILQKSLQRITWQHS